MRDFMKLLRTLHIYVSMFGLLILLFFAVTGFTLNHAEWFGTPVSREVTGKLDPALLKEPDKLAVAEELRRQFHLAGLVADFSISDDSCSVEFRRPGGSAHAQISRDTGEANVTIDDDGAVAVLNALHQGRDSGAGWSLLIDVTAWLMVFVSISGMALLFTLPKRRKVGLWAMVVGGVICVAAYFLFVP